MIVVADALVPKLVAAWAIPFGRDDPEPLEMSTPAARVTAAPPTSVMKSAMLKLESWRSSWLACVRAAYFQALSDCWASVA